MAVPYIPIRTDLADDEAVIGMAAQLGLDIDSVVGKLCRLWSWAHLQLRDGKAPGVPKEWVDDKVGVPGFAQAMADTTPPWLELVDGGIVFPKFEKFNSTNAKIARENAERAQKVRDLSREKRDAAVTGVRTTTTTTNKHEHEIVVESNNKGPAEAEPDTDPAAILERQGFTPIVAAQLAQADPAVIDRVLRNAAHMAAAGKLENPQGYIRKGIGAAYDLLPELAKKAAATNRNGRRFTRSQREYQSRQADEAATTAESVRVEKFLRAMDPADLAKHVEAAVAAAQPTTRKILGTARDPFSNRLVRSLVWGHFYMATRYDRR